MKHNLFPPLYFLCFVAFCVCASFIVETFAADQAQPDTNKPEIHIDGLEKVPLANAQARLQMLSWPSGKVTQRIRQQQNKTVKREIKLALEPYGYFKAKIKGTLQYTDGIWRAHYEVAPGPVLKVTQLQVKIVGDNTIVQQQLERQIKNLPLRQDQIFTVKRYENSVASLLKQAHDLGYIRAKFDTNQIVINRKAYTCHIDITLTLGTRYYFGATRFSDAPLSISLLRRFLNFKPGDPYSADTLLSLQQRLVAAGYFSNVTVQPRLKQAQDKNGKKTVPITVNLVPAKRKEYRIGVGYGTGTGPRALLGIRWRWVNAGGHSFNTQARLSPINNSFSVQYLIPGKDPTAQQYALTATNFYLSPNNAESSGVKAGISYRTQKNWRQTIFSLNYLYEHYRYSIDNAKQTASAVIPGISWSYRKKNRVINPSQVKEINLSFSGTDKYLSSSFGYAQFTVDGKFLHPLTPHWRIALRGQAGYTAVNDITSIPVSIAYYAGGAQSVRGYSELGLGPGRYLLVGSAELRRQIFGSWWATTFIDAGNAFNILHAPQLKRGIGIGLLWHSPIGGVQVSLARAESLPGKPIRFQFSIGAL